MRKRPGESGGGFVKSNSFHSLVVVLTKFNKHHQQTNQLLRTCPWFNTKLTIEKREVYHIHGKFGQYFVMTFKSRGSLAAYCCLFNQNLAGLFMFYRKPSHLATGLEGKIYREFLTNHRINVMLLHENARVYFTFTTHFHSSKQAKLTLRKLHVRTFSVAYLA